MKEQDNELFFVNIKDPSEIRRNILEILRDILTTIQSFEKFKYLRHEKFENMHKLRILVKDTNKMLADLKAKLPQTSIKATIVKEVPKHQLKTHTKKKKGKAIEQKTVKREMTDIEKLETQLSAIESKLKSLS